MPSCWSRGHPPWANPRPPIAEMKLASGLRMRQQVPNSAGPRPLGKQWRGPGLLSARSGGAMWSSHARGSVLAALGGGRRVLNRRLRDVVRLERGHLLGGAMMANMLDMMAPHLGVSLQLPRD